MQTQLAAVVAQLQGEQRRLHRLAAALPAERWGARADPTQWSAAECVAHLNLTSRAYVPLIRAALEQGRANAHMGEPAPRRYRRDPVGWLVSYAAGPLPRVAGVRIGRARTLPAFVPTGDQPREALVAEFDRLQGELIELAREADGLPLGELRITSPFDPRGKLRYNVYSAFVILPRHQRRHLWQAEHVWPAEPRTA